MRCERPIDVSVKSGSPVLSFDYVKDGIRRHRAFQGRSSFLVPCGKCFACKSRKKSQATFRMDCERRFGHVVKHKDGTSEVVRFTHCFFATLTYADEFLPYSWEYVDHRTGEQFVLLERQDEPVLFPYHLQSFFKRLRRYYKISCSYFAVGEYGDSFDRPHYHIVFYSDLDWRETLDAFRHAWSVECPPSRRNDPGTFDVVGKYCTRRLSIGRVNLKAVNMRRIRYCAKYVVKDNNSSNVVPKFAYLSHGLGSGFLHSEQARDTRTSRSLYAFSVDGKKCSLGRYYSHRLYTKDELKSLVDDFLKKDDIPEGFEGTSDYEDWFTERYLHDTFAYRAWKANQKNPLLVYF